MDKQRLREGQQVGAGADASTVGVPPVPLGICMPCHTLGRKRLWDSPEGEVNMQEAKDTGLVLGRSKLGEESATEG
eukprot:4936325-Prorocentrum_lima.AAC.1